MFPFHQLSLMFTFTTYSYFSTQHDVDVLVRGMRVMFSLAKSPSLSARIDQKEKNPEFDQDLHKMTDKQLEDVVRHRAETLYVLPLVFEARVTD